MIATAANMRTDPTTAATDAVPPRAEFHGPAQSLISRLSQADLPGAQRSRLGKPVAATGAPAEFKLFEHAGADRGLAEQFISRRFHESFGARVEAFMPRLFGMYDRDGKLCGALGLRSARHRLFVEHYLDQPIEQVITRHTACAIERASIVEVGHLSGTFPGAMRTLIWLLSARLHREGFEWVAFTGTKALRNAFRRNGLFPIDIQLATAGRLPPEARAAWGSYYEHSPRVFVGRIEEGVRRILRAQPEFGTSA
jgi:Thermostable hemolysin